MIVCLAIDPTGGLSSTSLKGKQWMSVNFKKVLEEARKQGIDPQGITIVYENLTPEDLALLRSHQVVTNESENMVLAHFPEEGFPILQSKATKVFYLGA
jgi:hypothetical protein